MCLFLKKHWNYSSRIIRKTNLPLALVVLPSSRIHYSLKRITLIGFLIFFSFGEHSTTIISPLLSASKILQLDETGNFKSNSFASLTLFAFSNKYLTINTELNPGLISSSFVPTKVIATTKPFSFIPSSPLINDDVVIFVLTPESKSIYSWVEVSLAAALDPERTVICVLPERAGKAYEGHEVKAVAKSVKDIKGLGVPVFSNLEELSQHLNERAKKLANKPKR
mgnify:CR=1 FL=1